MFKKYLFAAFVLLIGILISVEASGVNLCPYGMSFKYFSKSAVTGCGCPRQGTMKMPFPNSGSAFGKCEEPPFAVSNDVYNASMSYLPFTSTNLKVWLDASDPAGNGTPIKNGQKVSPWVDKSGNGNSPAITTTTAPVINIPAPSTNPSRQDSIVRPGVYFNNQFLQFSNLNGVTPSGNQNYTIIMVLRPQPDGAEARTAFTIRGATATFTPSSGQSGFTNWSGTTQSNLFFQSGQLRLNGANNNLLIASVAANQVYLVTQQMNNGVSATACSYITRVNGSQTVCRVKGNGQPAGFPTFGTAAFTNYYTPDGFNSVNGRIGALGNATSLYKGYIYEFLYFNVDIGTGNIINIENALMQKWNVNP